jgi:hypothetical protein
MTPVEAIIDALNTQADRHDADARSSGLLADVSDGYRIEALADRRVAYALRGVASEFALALGIER